MTKNSIHIPFEDKLYKLLKKEEVFKDFCFKSATEYINFLIRDDLFKKGYLRVSEVIKQDDILMSEQ